MQDPTTGLNEGQSIGEADLTVNFDSKETTGGDLTVTEITISEDRKGDFKGGEIPAVLKADGNNDIIAAVNAGKKVSYYKGGIAYYPVLIRHFDDTQANWNNAEYNNNGMIILAVMVYCVTTGTILMLRLSRLSVLQMFQMFMVLLTIQWSLGSLLKSTFSLGLSVLRM